METAVNDKNRQRRTIKVEKQLTMESMAVHDVKPTKSLDVVKRVFSYEEEESGIREPQADLELHRNVCAELRRIMQQVHQIKSGAANGCSPTDLDELKVHGLLQFVSLKKLNRIAHFRSKKVRDATSEAKLKVDQHHLKLQNLLYEVTHLQKEISKCLQFKSRDEEISLIPLEQFYKEASDDVLKNAETDEHRLTLARLDWELEQRKRLSTKLKEAAGMKDKIMSDVKTKVDFLDSLQPKLSNILQATKPVQDHLGMQFDLIRDQHRTAAYLPSPLYVLYMQASAYAEACDKHLSVTISGDVEMARTLERTTITVDDDVEDDAEEQEKAAEMRRRRISTVQTETNRLLKKHPLSVCLQINCRDKSQLSVMFSYLMSLNMAVVIVKIVPHETVSTISGGDLLQPDTLLSCLYPDDYGNKSPNPANNFVLNLGDFTKHVAEVGRPYMWVQWLCGLQFLDEDPLKAQVSLSSSHMSETVKRLRRRVRDRLSLQNQLAMLETGRIPVPKECIIRYPAKISSRLTHWKRTTYDDFIVHDYTRRLVETNLAKPEDMYFTCLVERGTAAMTVHIVLGTDYPNCTSLMVLALKWRSTIRTALNDEAIREMEAELNVPHEEPWSNDKGIDCLYLANQMQHLLVCMDVYLETNGSIQSKIGAGSVDFPQERICSRLTRVLEPLKAIADQSNRWTSQTMTHWSLSEVLARGPKSIKTLRLQVPTVFFHTQINCFVLLFTYVVVVDIESAVIGLNWRYNVLSSPSRMSS